MISPKSVARLLSAVTLLTSLGCSTALTITPSPSDAEISLRNTITQEVFQLGAGPQNFKPKTEYGNTFSIIASKKGFLPRELSVTPAPGTSTNYYLTLKPEPTGPDSAAVMQTLLTEKMKEFSTKIEEIEGKVKERLLALQKDAEERFRAAEEERRQAMLDRVRAELDRKNVEHEKKVKVLENTFEVYKDALFSDRYAGGPARSDRQRIDTSVDYVTRVQQSINQGQYAEAEKLVDRLLERDEYLAKGYALKGTVKYLLKKPEDSIVAYERALELDPSDRSTQRQLASLYQSTGRQPASKPLIPAEIAPNPTPAPAAPARPALKVRDN